MINVSYLPLNCESLDYSREEFVTKSSYLVVRCFQKRPKTNRPLLGTSPRLIIICSLAPTTAGMFYGISSFFFQFLNSSTLCASVRTKHFLRPRGQLWNCRFEKRFSNYVLNYFIIILLFWGEGVGDGKLIFAVKIFSRDISQTQSSN